jgi:hypothetical protein
VEHPLPAPAAGDPQWFEEFEAAARRPLAQRFLCHPDDIIASKAGANRVKDRESLPRLRAFRDYWKSRPCGRDGQC